LAVRLAEHLVPLAGKVDEARRQISTLPPDVLVFTDVGMNALNYTLALPRGNTSYEGLALGTPIVTLPGSYLRSRITLALYRKMQLMDCVADSSQQYIEVALRLATDTEYRQAISERIQTASHALYEDPSEVREFERFLTWSVNGNASRPFPAATGIRDS
jgi:hypothetical protein